MMCAYGHVCGNDGSGMVDEGVVRKDWRIGPNRPCGSMANGMRMVLASTSSRMMVSPGIVNDVLL